MSKHEDHVRLRHMLEHAKEAVSMTEGKSRFDLDTERQLNLALVRLMEIVGEAAARVSSDFQDAHSNIPWMKITGLRNRLIHGYDEVDFDILWNIIKNDLPLLISNLQTILESK